MKVKFSIETTEHVIDCRSTEWPLLDSSEGRLLQSQLLQQKSVASQLDKKFIVTSNFPIPDAWQNWLQRYHIFSEEEIL